MQRRRPLVAAAEALAAAVGTPTGAASRSPGRRTATRRSRWRWPGPGTRSWRPGPCTARCCWASCWPGSAPVWVVPDVDPVSGLPGGIPVERLRQALHEHPAAQAVFVVEPGYVGRAVRRRRPGRRRPRGRRRRSSWTRRGRRTSASTPTCPPHALDGRRRRDGDQRPQGAPVVHAGRAGARPYRPAGPGPARARLRGHAHDQPGRRHRGEHRRRPAAAGPRRRTAARPHDPAGARGPRPARRGRRAARPGRPAGPGRPDPAGGRAGRYGGGRDRRRGRPGRPPGSRWSWPTATRSSRRSPWPTRVEAVEPFVDALVASVERRRAAPRAGRHRRRGSAPTCPRPRSPRARRSSPRTRPSTPRPRSVGSSAELVAPYPPGIPAIVPGEVVAVDVLDALREAAAAGVRVAYAADPTLATLQVVARD